MAKIKKNYTKKGLTVVWEPDLCIHSTKCFKGLPGVFDPQKRPWINVDGASTDEIKSQIEICPSGALSFLLDDIETKTDNKMNDKIKIDVSDNGPILVQGPVIVKYKNGEEIREAKTTAFCRCGSSGNKPYCDGSHKKVGFVG